jgi:hypothetical protein
MNTGSDSLDFARAPDRIAALGYHTRNVRKCAARSLSDYDSIVGYLPLKYIALSDLRDSANSFGNDGEISLRNAGFAKRHNP